MRFFIALSCILFAAFIVMPVMAEESIGVIATEPVVTLTETHVTTTVPTPEHTKEPTTEPTKVITREITTEPTREPTREHTTETTREPTSIPTTSTGPRVGWISILSTPSGATVSLDGKTVGFTPVSGTEVGSGISHTVRITMEGYEPYETRVTVNPGEESGVDATLKAIATPTPTPSPAPTIIGAGKGWIRVHANVDGATVSFDSLSSGCTISGGSCSVEVGTTSTPFKTFTVQKPGYAIYKGQVTAWPMEGETVDLYATLNPSPTTGTVQVSSYPNGAVATLDGGNWQYTTATFSPVSAGTNHYVQISMNGYQTYATTIYVTAGETAYVSASLVPVTPQPSTGSLRVKTYPAGADIYLDGRYAASTPATLPGLASGTHSLRLQKAGYDEYLRTFTITAGQRTTEDYTFSRSPSGVGSVEVTSTPPGATVFLDGNYMGLTPPGDYLDLTSLAVGPHTITLRMTDYEDYTQTSYIGDGKIVTINAQLTPASSGQGTDTTGEITVVSSPSGANLFLDNAFRGITPLTLSDIPQGSHVVTARLAGYADATETVTVTGGRTTPVALGLASAETTTAAKSPLTMGSLLLGLVIVSVVIALKKR